MHTTSSRLVDLLGAWRGHGAAHEALAATMRSLVLDGRLPLESRLPPERQLALDLGLSRTTVTAAYGRLRREGYLASRHGSGSWVTVPGGHRAAPDAVVPARGIDLRVAALPAPALLDELAQAAVAELPRWLDHHGYDPLGLPPLRAAIAARFTERGLPTRPQEILVTNGALHALDLVIRTVAARGRSALVEIPSYPAALDALRAARMRVAAVPVGLGGWDVDELGRIARDVEPALAYLIPDFQNPTGALMDGVTRRRAFGSLARAGTYVVIDETFVELGLDGDPLPPPAACHGNERTITVGSLGKAGWGGLRVGWARADASLVQRLAVVRSSTDLASPVLEQLIAVQVFERLDEVARERRARLRAGRAALAGELGAHLPEWRFSSPHGGMFLWVELPEPVSTGLAVQAHDLGVHITPGPRFGAAGLLERYLRLPFTLPRDQLAHAVAVLSSLAHASNLRRGRRPAVGYVA